MKENNSLLKNLTLAYYANQLSVYFKAESIIAHSVGYVMLKTKEDRVYSQQISDTAVLISNIF